MTAAEKWLEKQAEVLARAALQGFFGSSKKEPGFEAMNSQRRRQAIVAVKKVLTEEVAKDERELSEMKSNG